MNKDKWTDKVIIWWKSLNKILGYCIIAFALSPFLIIPTIFIKFPNLLTEKTLGLFSSYLFTSAQRMIDKEKPQQTIYPAPDLCDELYETREECEKDTKNQLKCLAFVNAYKKLLSHSGAAVYQCGQQHEISIELLRGLRMKEAVELFGSDEMLRTLDGAGALAESYLETVERVGKELKQGKKWDKINLVLPPLPDGV